MNLKTILCLFALLCCGFAANAATLSVSQTNLQCPTSMVGMQANCGTVSLMANGGDVTVYQVSIVTMNAFSVMGSCPQARFTLASGESCTYTIGFWPMMSGDFDGSISLPNSAVDQMITMHGSTPSTSGTLAVMTPPNCGTVSAGASGSCGDAVFMATGGSVTLSSTFADANVTYGVNDCWMGRTLNSDETCTVHNISVSIPQNFPSGQNYFNLSLGTTIVQFSAWVQQVQAQVVAPSTVDCGTYSSGIINCDVLIQNNSGTARIQLNVGWPWSLGYSSCDPYAETVLGQGQSCVAHVTRMIQPGDSGALSGDLYISEMNTGQKHTLLTATVTPPDLIISPSFFDLGTTPQGSPAVTRTVTLSAVNGQVTGISFSSTSKVNITGSCPFLNAGQSCQVTLTASTAQSGSLSSMISVTSSVSPKFISFQGAIGPPPFTYHWLVEGYSACTGGSGTWNVGEWAPASGCGMTDQTRSVTCIVSAGSGTQTPNTVCQRSDGAAAAEFNCDPATKPAPSACTPPDSACGAAPASSQRVDMETSCVSRCKPDAESGTYCLLMPM